jgi:hypothetical protein
MFKDLFVPYQESMELKQLGFDEPCFAYYDEEAGETEPYEYANCCRNVTGDKSCYNYDFLSVTNSQLDKYGAFGAKDEEGNESYERWTAPIYDQAFKFIYLQSNKKIDIQTNGSDSYEEKCIKLKNGIDQLRDL